ncbi:uncharacterized protein LOC107263682 isoform X2 [Cephus cinctus]|uniref:Uncharacterized protein LOC107263682 isoform X2 n=1 Tax=Cephus cinctus TaxID=211228 RepID=A0AAJ7R9L3_CEPCN|nr:uncharacterized protein LOC107263682 isoform X2 [Cephus cinctus]
MALTLVRKAAKCFHHSQYTKVLSTRFYSLYEPDYLELLKPKIPIYTDLHVQIKSFAFPVLESYQAYINTIAEHMDIDVEDSSS